MPRKTASDLDWTSIDLAKSNKQLTAAWQKYLDARSAVKAQVETALKKQTPDGQVVRVAFKHSFGQDGLSYAFADAPNGTTASGKGVAL